MGLVIPHQYAIGQITDRALPVRPDLALAQREHELAERAGTTGPAEATADTADAAGEASQQLGNAATPRTLIGWSAEFPLK